VEQNRKKILWLCSWYPSKLDLFNGDFIQRHAKAAAAFNDIYVIYVAGDNTGKADKKEREISKSDGLTEHIVYFPVSTSFTGKIRAHLKYLFVFKQAIRRYLVENGKPDLVHVHVPMKAGILALWLKKRYKVPFIITEHYGIYNEETGKDSYLKRSRVFRNYTRRIFQQASVFVTVSKFLAEGVNRMVGQIHYTLVHNTVDTDFFFSEPKDQSSFRFIHVSNMVPLKNAEGILRAFKTYLAKGGRATLRLVGNPDDSLPNYAASLGLTKDIVSFTGLLSYQQVAAEMQKSDCLILFSNIENSPCVIGEALCCGLPVIASNVGGIPELVNSDNSILISPGNEDELVAAMIKITSVPEKYDRKKIAETASGKFSYLAIGEQLDTIYRKILNP
jgi:glycosyltransferase involved in cell wall biosynthesis